MISRRTEKVKGLTALPLERGKPRAASQSTIPLIRGSLSMETTRHRGNLRQVDTPFWQFLDFFTNLFPPERVYRVTLPCISLDTNRRQ